MSPPHTPQAEATLARLAPHLQRRPDLPALSGATREVQRVSRRETAHVRALVEAAERDPGLSARLLRLANTAACASAGAGANDSIDRAIRLLGFDTVRSLAAGLPMLDLGAGPDSPVLAREWLLRSLLAAQIARELCDHGRLADAAHLAALFQNLGRLLLAVHLPQDAAAVRRATPPTAWPRAPHEDRAARRHLGWQLPALGAQVARQWGWPASVRASMTRPLAPSPRPARERDEQLRRLAQTANDLADLLIDTDPRHWRQACDDCVAAGDTGAGRDADVLLAAMARTRPQLEALAELVALPRSEQARWQRADITRMAPGAEEPVDADAGPVSPLHETAAPPPPVEPASAPAAPCPSANTDTGASIPVAADDVATMTTLHRALSARRTVLWRAPAAGEPLQPCRVLGEGLPAAAHRQWRVDAERGADLFSRLLRHGRETLIHDARAPSLARHLPEAFRRDVAARSFVIVPLPAGRQGPGLLYVDRHDHRPFTLDGDALQLVRTLHHHGSLSHATAPASA